MLALRTALSEHYWLLYGMLGAFVCFVVLIEAWLNRRTTRRTHELYDKDAIKPYTDYMGISEAKTVYALPKHVGETGKTLCFDDGGCTVTSEEIQNSLKKSLPLITLEPTVQKVDWKAIERTIEEISGWKQGPTFILANPESEKVGPKVRRRKTIKKKSPKRKKKIMSKDVIDLIECAIIFTFFGFIVWRVTRD